MRILGIILFEFLLGYILQAFCLVLGLHVLSKSKLVIKKYIISSMIMAAVIYVTRLLPVSFGVHTILDFVAAFLLGILFLKLPVISTAKADMIVLALVLFLDLADSLIFSYIIDQVEFLDLMNDELMRSILALPTAILLAAVVLLVHYLLVSKKKKQIQENKGYPNEDITNDFI